MKKYTLLLLSFTLLVTVNMPTLHAQEIIDDSQSEQQEYIEEQVSGSAWEATKHVVDVAWTVATTISGAVVTVVLGDAFLRGGVAGIHIRFCGSEPTRICAGFFFALLSVKYLYKTQRALDRVLYNLGRAQEQPEDIPAMERSTA